MGVATLGATALALMACAVFGMRISSPPAKLRFLIVDSNAKRAATVQRGLDDFVDADVHVVARGSDLVTLLRTHGPNVAIVSLDAPDRALVDQLRAASRETPRPIVLFVERSDEALMREAVATGVSAYVVDGLAPERVKAVVDVAMARFEATEGLRRELEEAKTTLAERKIIDRAKGILMQTRAMSEDEAYKALRKLAMDQGRKMADVAQTVVSVSDLLKGNA
jgi:response regulator NasT